MTCNSTTHYAGCECHEAGWRDRLAKENHELRGKLERAWQTHNKFLNGPYSEAQKELHGLRWFADQVNSRVMPGEMDTQDSAYALIQDLRAERDRLRKRVGALEKVAEAARNVGMNWKLGAPYGFGPLGDALDALKGDE